MDYKLAKIIGNCDLMNHQAFLITQYLKQGHVTLGDHGDDYDPATIVGQAIAVIYDSEQYLLYAKLYNGPDQNSKIAHHLVQALKVGRIYKFSVILGKTPDKREPKLRVVLDEDKDPRNAVKLIDDLDLDALAKSSLTEDGFTYDSNDPLHKVHLWTGDTRVLPK